VPYRISQLIGSWPSHYIGWRREVWPGFGPRRWHVESRRGRRRFVI